MNTNQRGEGLVSNILAVAGFIILIVIIIWGAFHFLNLASSGFSSLFSRSSANTIQLTLPSKTVNSGQPFDLAWRYNPTNDGSYAILYQCRDGFQFRVAVATSTMNNIPCGSAYTIGGREAKNVRLVPVLGAGTTVDVPFSIIYMTAAQSGTTSPTTRAQGNTTVTVVRTGGQPTTGTPTTGTPTTPTTPTTPAPTTPTPTTPKPVGKPDLRVTILAVGVIDANGTFVARAPISQHEVAAVKFDIANVGSGPSGAWYFTAQLPTSPATPYTSPQQKSLGAGDHIENTLRFNQVTPGGGTFTVSVDPNNQVGETNEMNNYASQFVSGGYYSHPYPYGY